MPKPFDFLTLYARYGREQQVSLNDPTTARAFLEDIRVQLDRALTDPIRVHGQRAQAMFEALVVALGRFTLLKTEDRGRVHPPVGFRVPDFRVVLESGDQWLIEVKNVYEPDPFHQRRQLMKPGYLADLDAYAKATKATLKLAVFWARWGFWTLLSPHRLVDGDGYVKLEMFDAFRFNELSELGDRFIGTTPPLMLRIVADDTKPNLIGPDGNVQFTIGGGTLFCGGREVTRPAEQEIAWILMNFGDWVEETPRAVVENNRLRAIEFVWEPLEQNNEGFEMIGSLSRMFSRYYALETLSGREVVQIEAEPRPGWLASLSATDYKGMLSHFGA